MDVVRDVHHPGARIVFVLRVSGWGLDELDEDVFVFLLGGGSVAASSEMSMTFAWRRSFWRRSH